MNPDANLMDPQTNKAALWKPTTSTQTPFLNTDPKKLFLFDIFLHVNRALTPDQRGLLRLIFGPDATMDSVTEAIRLLNKKIDTLTAANWKPIREPGDQVQTPAHYDRFPMEPTYFIVTSGGFHWCLENYLKYVTRFPFKNGIEDLGKARRNLSMFVMERGGAEGWSR